MRVKVSLHLNLVKYSPNGKRDFEIDLAGGTTINSLLKSLAIPARVERVILVNGRHASQETQLFNKDRVILFPPISGG